MKILFLVTSAALCVANGDVVHLLTPPEKLLEVSTPPPPPKPYAFGYAAGRFPGHIDRTHSEVSDGSGVVQGSYSYVDPRHQIRTVEYVADKNGFHPSLSHGPEETVAVKNARARHLRQFAKIAEAHQQNGGNLVIVPVDSVAVSHAKDKHLSLYQKIALEHARIAAERETDSGTAKPIY